MVVDYPSMSSVDFGRSAAVCGHFSHLWSADRGHLSLQGSATFFSSVHNYWGNIPILGSRRVLAFSCFHQTVFAEERFVITERSVGAYRPLVLHKLGLSICSRMAPKARSDCHLDL